MPADGFLTSWRSLSMGGSQVCILNAIIWRRKWAKCKYTIFLRYKNETIVALWMCLNQSGIICVLLHCRTLSKSRLGTKRSELLAQFGCWSGFQPVSFGHMHSIDKFPDWQQAATQCDSWDRLISRLTRNSSFSCFPPDPLFSAPVSLHPWSHITKNFHSQLKQTSLQLKLPRPQQICFFLSLLASFHWFSLHSHLLYISLCAEKSNWIVEDNSFLFCTVGFVFGDVQPS